MSSESVRPDPATVDPTNADDEAGTFADLGLRAELLGALSALGYEEPTADPAGGDPAPAGRA